MKKTEKTVKPTVAAGRNANRKGMSYTKLSQDQKRAIIASRKRRGDNQAIANELNYTSTYVSQVTTGVHENSKIVNRMYDKVRARKVKIGISR